MSELFAELLKAQPDILLMLAGLILIGIGVVGSIKSYIDPGKWGRIGALGIGVILLTIGVTLHARELAAMARNAISPGKPAPMSSICTFDAGPLAGKTAELPQTQIASIGSPCQDTSGNKGYLVAPDTPLTNDHTKSAKNTRPSGDKPLPLPESASPEPKPQPVQQQTAQMSHTCHWTSGPAAGKTVVYYPDAAHTPGQVGTPCVNKFNTNIGIYVAENAPAAPTLPNSTAVSANSRVCSFNAGPLIGSIRELPRDKLQSVGGSCHDRAGSSGLIVAPNTPVTP